VSAAAEARGDVGRRGPPFPVLLPWLPLLVSCAAPAPSCPADNAGLTLPDGFCALVVADSLGRARHLTVAANGDVLVAIPARDSGGVLLLRDTTGDGVADTRRMLIHDPLAVDVQLRESGGQEYVYYSTYHEVIRYAWTPGSDAVSGSADTIVRELPGGRQHGMKTFTLADGDRLFVNHGAPSNSCQMDDRQPGSMGRDPCPLLDTTGGIWLYAADRTGQTGADGERYATGLRNTVALTVNPADGEL
jgi:glucose/arabinose dehydrogenase